MNSSQNLQKYKAGFLFALAIVVFLLNGCKFIEGLKKEAKEEKKILGYVEGYNPRVKEIQTLLKEAGFEPGLNDGTMDKVTRKAIRDFQRANKLTDSGFIDAATLSRLNRLSLEKERKRQEVRTKERAKEIKNLMSSPEQIKKVQRALKNAGFNPGPINGIVGVETKKAIVAFQKSKGLTADGIVGSKTWRELNKYLTTEE